MDQAKTDKQTSLTIAQAMAQAGAPTTLATQAASGTPQQAIQSYAQFMNGDTSALPQSVQDAANGVITGADGKQYDLSNYATDPQQKNHVLATSSLITKNFGPITDANTAQEAIDSLPTGKNSPITGAMVVSAAQQYGVDPSMLLGVMQAETQLGTDGSKGAQGNNFGNVGNTDTAMANGQPVNYPTAQDGVNAVAQNLAGRVAETNGAQNPTGGLQSTGNSIDIYNQLQKSAPPAVSGLIQYTGDPKNGGSGDIYMLPTTDANALSYARKNNIKIVSSQDVDDLKTLNTALTNLSAVSSQFSKVSEGNVGGKIMSAITNPSAEVFDTERGKDINSYISTTLPAAINALGAITGNTRLSAYTGSISSSALPAVGTNPLNAMGADTTQGGLEKINAIKAQINNALRTILPNSKGATTRVQIIDPETGQVQTGTIDPKDFDNKTMTILQ